MLSANNYCMYCGSLLVNINMEPMCPQCHLLNNMNPKQKALDALLKEMDYRMKEKINHPKHYNETEIEVIDIIESYELNFNLGNAVKYLFRCSLKDENMEVDIKKALWYLKRAVEKNTIPHFQPRNPIPVRKALFGRVLPLAVENSLYAILLGLGNDTSPVYESIVLDSISTAIYNLEHA